MTGRTITEKILAAHAVEGAAPAGAIVTIRPDVVLLNDVSGPLAFEQFAAMGATRPFDPARIVLPADELRSWRWCDEADVEARTPPYMARRLRAALLARASGVTVELENGGSPGTSS